MQYNKTLLVSVILGSFASAIDHHKETYCYTRDEHPYLLFSTKSAYDLLHGDLSKVSDHESCKPIQIWSLIRHGTRYPNEEEIRDFGKLHTTLEEIKQNFAQGRGTLCKSDYELLMTWKWNFSIKPEMFKELHPYCIEELKGIGERFKKKYPMLLEEYSKDDFHFQYTKSARTKASYEGYVEGLYGKNHSHVHVIESNDVIKQYKSCDRWQKELGYNEPVVLKEYYKFERTKEYQDLVARTSRRLGFVHNIDTPLIEVMYQECIYEKSWSVHEPSKWCTAFEKEDYPLLEYGQDLQVYYKSGYGSYYNPRLGCAMVEDLYKRMERKIDGTLNEPRVISMFTHSTAMHQFFEAMEFFKDEIPPAGDNYPQQKNRKWRTSLFGQFATNFVAVLYRCEDDHSDEHKIQFLLGEHPFDVTDDCVNGFCPWSSFKKKYYKTAHSCNIDFCNAGSRQISVLLIISMMLCLNSIL